MRSENVTNEYINYSDATMCCIYQIKIMLLHTEKVFNKIITNVYLMKYPGSFNMYHIIYKLLEKTCISQRFERWIDVFNSNLCFFFQISAMTFNQRKSRRKYLCEQGNDDVENRDVR